MESINYKKGCPVCGSSTIMEILVTEAKLAGTMNPDSKMALTVVKGDMIDRTIKYQPGDKVANYFFTVDGCSNPECGIMLIKHFGVGEQQKEVNLVIPGSRPLGGRFSTS